MKRRRLLRVIAGAGAVGLAGCGGGDGGGTETTTLSPTESPTADAFTIQESELSVADGVATVSGTAENTGGNSLSFAEIAATFLDADGNEVGTATASTTYWGSGSMWEFEITYDGEGADSVEDYELAKSSES